MKKSTFLTITLCLYLFPTTVFGQQQMFKVFKEYELDKKKNLDYDASEIVFLTSEVEKPSEEYLANLKNKQKLKAELYYEQGVKYVEYLENSLEEYFDHSYVLHVASKEELYTEEALSGEIEKIKYKDISELYIKSDEIDFLEDYRYVLFSNTVRDVLSGKVSGTDYYLFDLENKTKYFIHNRDYPIIPDDSAMKSWNILLGKLNDTLEGE